MLEHVPEYVEVILAERVDEILDPANMNPVIEKLLVLHDIRFIHLDALDASRPTVFIVSTSMYVKTEPAEKSPQTEPAPHIEDRVRVESLKIAEDH